MEYVISVFNDVEYCGEVVASSVEEVKSLFESGSIDIDKEEESFNHYVIYEVDDNSGDLKEVYSSK